MTNWNIELGEELTRDELRIKGRFKVPNTGGIAAPADAPFVVIFSNREIGEKSGYIYDGWSENNETFLYTGQRSSGDQTFIRYNKSILEAQDNGRSIHVFCANQPNNKKGPVVFKYIGEFYLEDTTTAESLGKDGRNRQVIVFKFKPSDSNFIIREQDQCPYPLIPKVSISKKIPTKQGPVDDEAEVNVSDKKDLPKRTPGGGTRKATEASEVTTPEYDLEQRFKKYLEKNDLTYYTRNIAVVGNPKPLELDLIIEETNELCEVKGSAVREKVRMAIGQILDYENHLKEDGFAPNYLAIILPSKPATDLLKLLKTLNISCVYETEPNIFQRQGSLPRNL